MSMYLQERTLNTALNGEGLQQVELSVSKRLADVCTILFFFLQAYLWISIEHTMPHGLEPGRHLKHEYCGLHFS